MALYVVAATIVEFLSAWAWFQYLFPHAVADVAGTPGAEPIGRGRHTILTIISLIILAAAMGTFIRHRSLLDGVDMIKLPIKVWFGFLLPVGLAAWAHTRASVTTLVATVGFWLVAAIECAILANWLLLP